MLIIEVWRIIIMNKMKKITATAAAMVLSAGIAVG